MGQLFGTDGVRGVANRELTPVLAYQLGRFGAHVLTEGTHKARIIIGMDTRLSGDMLEHALVAGILSSGCDAICIGVTTTPAVAFLTRHYGCDAGVMISASHNPAKDNGIKFFNSKGLKLSDAVEDQIEDFILNGKDLPVIPGGTEVGRCEKHREGNRIYSEYLKTTIPGDLTGLKIAMDCANGSAFEIAPSLFRELGAQVVVTNNHPDGLNINNDCGSTHPENVARLTKEVGAHLGLAFDGDADRLIASDENGRVIDGDRMMMICGIDMKNSGRLKGDTIVTTVMSNIGLDMAAKENGIKTFPTKVGDRYVLEAMLREGYSLGGEQSGHIIFLDHNTTGDGILSALQLAAVIKKTGKPLSQLADVMTQYPQILLNAKIKNGNKNSYLEDPVVSSRIQEIEAAMQGEGRVLIRPSGTEPLVRVMLEGKDQEQLKAYATELVGLIEERL